MKRSAWIWCAGAVAAFVAAVLWMPLKEDYSEVDIATGSVRTRQVQLGLFERHVRTEPSWMELQAKAQGIAFTPDWQLMSHQAETCLTWSCGLGRYRHVAEQLALVGNGDAAEREAFMRRYLPADTEVRVKMLNAWDGGDTNKASSPEIGGEASAVF